MRFKNKIKHILTQCWQILLPSKYWNNPSLANCMEYYKFNLKQDAATLMKPRHTIGLSWQQR